MGNNCCVSRSSASTGINLDKKEKKILKEMFNSLASSQPETQGKNYICEKAVVSLFPENKQFGRQVFRFMQLASGTDIVTCNSYLQAVDILTKDQKNPKYMNDYRSFDKMEIFALISFNAVEVKSKQDLKTLLISYVDALKYMTNVLSIFLYEKINCNIDEKACRALVDGIYKNVGVTSCWDFLFFVKQELIYLSKVLDFYFSFKFLGKTVHFKLPMLTEASYLLNEEVLAMFYLSNAYMQNVSRMKLLYSNVLHGFDFKKVVDSIANLEMPLLFLIRHEEPNEEKNSYIFGAFTCDIWKNTANYHGSENTYIYSLTPSFRNFFPVINDYSEKNYQYLWHTENMKNVAPVGLGFGGSNKRNFRLWIDGTDMANNSSVSSQDHTYPTGYLADPHIEKLKITNFEIWGMGTDAAYSSHLMDKSKNQRYLYIREFNKYYKKTETGLLKSKDSSSPPGK